MDQLIAQVVEIARAMWRRRWVGIGAAWLAAIVGAVGLSTIQDRFEATARVYVDTKTVLRPLMRDLAVEPDLDQTVGLLARTLITRPNVELLMRKSFPEAQSLPPDERERALEGLLREIKVTSSNSRDNIFNFSYRGTDPEKTRLVVENLVALFLASDTGTKQRDAESAREFIDEQISSYETRLADAENRLKEFKLRNMGVSDVSGKDYFARMSALTEDMGKVTVELKAAEQSRDALRHELGGETASLVPETPTGASTAASSEYDARLEGQRKQLDELLRRYTDQHPDVIATKRLIESLEEDRRKDIENRRKIAESKPARASQNINSVQQQVRLALAQAEAEVASLRVRAGDMQSRVAQLRASASRVPQIEAEMAQLNRDYEVIRGAYQTMVARREKAALSEDVDATRSAQFRVIDPPRTAPQPVFPNRLALAILVVVGSIAAGLGATFLVVQVLPAFGSTRLLREATRRQVLGSVSMVRSGGMVLRARGELIGFGSALGSLLVAAGVWLAWLNARG